jgi:hypothetical protein
MSPILFVVLLAATAVAFGLIKLGALSVWVSVLSLALQGVMALAIAAAVIALTWFIWNRWKA